MTTKPGPTETRVRAALLRLWEKHVAEHWTDQESSWPATKVLYEDRLENGQSGQSIESTQRVGLRLAKGGWFSLSDDTEATYERGVFRVRRGEAANPDPSLRKAFADLRALDGPSPRPAATLRQRITALADSLETGLDGQPNMAGRFIAEELRRIMAEPSDGDDEPRVTQRQLDMMRRATGRALDAERNHHCHPLGTDGHRQWTELVEMGLARRLDAELAADPAAFAVTEAGFRMTYGDVRKPRKRGRRG